MATVPPEEKVVLVGHSLGGMNIALAMEKFPEKVSVSVFLTAFMPDSDHNPAYVLDQVIISYYLGSCSVSMTWGDGNCIDERFFRNGWYDVWCPLKLS